MNRIGRINRLGNPRLGRKTAMNVSLPLDQMSTAEKLLTLESLWDDLCRHAEEVPSPSWHKTILDDRESRLRRGAEGVTDWETAKHKIRESLP
jgi:hypothetical protein